MRSVMQNEIEYLGANDGEVANPALVDEMCRRLNALRRFEQNINESDWRPQAHKTNSLASSTHIRLM